jgi:tetratricopeptide (TPR) repeat protein
MSTRRKRVGMAVALAGAAALMAALYAWTAIDTSTAIARVRVWQDSLVLPTYEEGPPDVNAPFDIFTTTRFSYPYTIRDQLTQRRTSRRWRTLNLENEYLRCVVLPDLGGHLYTCVDKMTGRDMFYANSAIKLANIAYRGAWAALGIEFNFPVSHSWTTVSPVDFATRTDADGSASIWVGNVDRVYGGQWRVELTMRPHRAVLEQHTWLYNRSARRHRFYWWTNAAVRVQDDSRIHYPMRHTAAHGFAEVDTWPVNAKGVDLSVVGNHTDGPVSLFSYGSREPFMAVYHPSTHTGVAHISSPVDLPAKKFWSWGSDPDGLDWRVALSDDKSAYVEVQAGLFRNQETYAFLEPQETIAFTEYWIPIGDIGGLVRASPDAALNLARTPDASGRIRLDAAFTVTRPLHDGRLRLLNGSQVVADEPLVATPSHVVRRTYQDLPAQSTFTLELKDARGVLVTHTEGHYDLTPAAEIKTGPQALPRLPPAAEQTEAQVVLAGEQAELEGKLLDAYRTYQRGLERFSDSFGLSKAAGRLALNLKRPGEAIEHLTRAAVRISNDPEVEYYLGEAYLLAEDERHARPHLEMAQQRSAFRAAARLELARLHARGGDLVQGARVLDESRTEFPDAGRLGQPHVAVLRHLGRHAEAVRLLDGWRRADPTSSGLRYEAVLLGGSDEALWPHLGADPERVLEIASEYFDLGFFDDATSLLSRPLPAPAAGISEPGTPAAADHPLLAYYRGYSRLQSERGRGTEEGQGSRGNRGTEDGQGARGDQSPDADFDAASRMPTTYIFPNRPETGRVLLTALSRHPADATARFLLGSWYLSGGRVEPAIEAWQTVRASKARIPGLHRNLGTTYLLALNKPELALDVFREGLVVDPPNVGIYVGIDQALSLTGHDAAERAEALSRYPLPRDMPAALTYKLALAHAEAGHFDEADRLFQDRFFPREEGGMNVRQVYLEVRLLRARNVAAAGRCEEALGVADHMRQPVNGLPFTADGLEPFLELARIRYEIAAIEAQCGRVDAARRQWTALRERGPRFSFVDVTFAFRAAVQLCRVEPSSCRETTTVWPARLEAALATATRQVDVVGSSTPGGIRTAQGLLLTALGRPDEARQRFRDALLAPDRNLSHHLAREGLAWLNANSK